MELAFRLLALLLAAASAYFLWTEQHDAFYITAVLGCVSFFLSIRSQVKKRNDQRAAEMVEDNPLHLNDD